MNFKSLSPLFLSMVLPAYLSVAQVFAQVAPPAEVTLGQPTYGGNGCPQGTASAVLSDDRKSLSILFDSFQADAGRAAGKQVDRKTCNLAVPVQVPQGYSVSVFKLDYRGFASIPANASGNFSVEYFFAGSQGPKYSKNFSGPMTDDFTLTNELTVDSMVWSACGADVNLRANAGVFATSNQAGEQSTISLDSADITSGVIFLLQWKRCDAPQPIPSATPTVTPTPNPTPSATPTVIPTPVPTGGPILPPVDFVGLGRRDGESVGSQEGKAAGAVQGRERGLDLGFKTGFGACEEEARNINYNNGWAIGDRDGTQAGYQAGIATGQREGQERGNADGYQDGTRRADADALKVAGPAGAAKGQEEANRSDASAKGNQQGIIDGDAEALRQAIATDYGRGREDYRARMFAERVVEQIEIDQGSRFEGGSIGLRSLLTTSSAKMRTNALILPQAVTGGINDAPIKAKQFCSTQYAQYANCPAEFERGFREGFRTGFDRDHPAAYQAAYNVAFNNGKALGCADARKRDYRASFEEGRQAGYRAAYDYHYKAAYDQAFQGSYRQAFPVSSERAYREQYQGFYNKHFESARAAAYQQRYNDLYQAAYAQAKRQKFNEMYPIYAKQQFDRGVADEKLDFERRPVRLLGAKLVQEREDGVIEPEEKVMLELELRNFAGAAVDGQKLLMEFLAGSGAQFDITKSQEALKQAIPAKSVAKVKGVFLFKVPTARLEVLQDLSIRLSYEQRESGVKELSTRAQRLIGIELLALPEFRLGYAGTVKYVVSNRSNQTQSFNVGLAAQIPGVKFTSLAQTVSNLAGGERREIGFGFNNELLNYTTNVKLELSADLLAGRRVGLNSRELQVAGTADFLVEMRTEDLTDLRNKGRRRVRFTLHGNHNRSVGQVVATAHFVGANAGRFQVMQNMVSGRQNNSREFDGFGAGDSVRDNFAVKSVSDNSGATFVLEVRVGGKLLGRYTEAF